MPTKLTPLAQAHTRRSLQKLLTTLHKKALRPAINKFTILIHADAFGHNTIFGRLQINDGDDVFLDRLIILWQFLICGLPYTLQQAKNDVFTVRFNQEGMLLFCPKKEDRKSTRLNSSHVAISYAVFCLKKKIYK